MQNDVFGYLNEYRKLLLINSKKLTTDEHWTLNISTDDWSVLSTSDYLCFVHDLGKQIKCTNSYANTTHRLKTNQIKLSSELFCCLLFFLLLCTANICFQYDRLIWFSKQYVYMKYYVDADCLSQIYAFFIAFVLLVPENIVGGLKSRIIIKWNRNGNQACVLYIAIRYMFITQHGY